MTPDLLSLLTGQPFPPHGPETATTADGWVYDTATGEVVGCLDDDQTPLTSRFEVTDEQSADWVLRKRQEVDAQIAALTIHKRAIEEQFNRRIRAQHQRLAYLDWRFGASLIAFARAQLTKGSRTLRLTFGTVKFRRTKGTNKIVSMEEAVRWVEERNPELVKIRKTVTATTVLELAGGQTPPGFMKSTGGGERVVIDTGIEATTPKPKQNTKGRP